jgi:hypothetical protein
MFHGCIAIFHHKSTSTDSRDRACLRCRQFEILKSVSVPVGIYVMKSESVPDSMFIGLYAHEFELSKDSFFHSPVIDSYSLQQITHLRDRPQGFLPSAIFNSSNQALYLCTTTPAQ